MKTENSITPEIIFDNTDAMRADCYQQWSLITEKAKTDKRKLTPDESRVLSDLARALANLNKATKQQQVVRRQKIILAKDPPGLD